MCFLRSAGLITSTFKFSKKMALFDFSRSSPMASPLVLAEILMTWIDPKLHLTVVFKPTVNKNPSYFALESFPVKL